MDLEKLRSLRDRLDQTDAQLIQTIAERQAIVAEIGRVKEAGGKQLRDFKREAEVLQKVRHSAQANQLDGQLAEDVMKRLIEASLTQQEQKRIRNAQLGDAKHALIIGGNGKMGRWFAEFLDALGFSVEINDPSGAPDGFTAVHDWRTRVAAVDVIVLATPLNLTADVLHQLSEQTTEALVLDIASLKSPLMPAITNAVQRGIKVCSIHPMFGPDTQLLSDRHILLMRQEHAEPATAQRLTQALADTKALFAATSAELVEIPLPQHDELIAFVLGLSHAVNIVFAHALANSGEAAPTLAKLSSTTFDRQLKIATSVAQENPQLYFDIQALNSAREHSLQALESAVAHFASCVRAADQDRFIAMMLKNRDYLASRQ